MLARTNSTQYAASQAEFFIAPASAYADIEVLTLRADAPLTTSQLTSQMSARVYSMRRAAGLSINSSALCCGDPPRRLRSGAPTPFTGRSRLYHEPCG